MASQEERMLILKMIDEGKISADEGARLLSAIQVEDSTAANAAGENAAADNGPGKAPNNAPRAGQEKSSSNSGFASGKSDGVRIDVENLEPDAAEVDAQGSLASRSGTARNIRLRVSDSATDQEKVDVNVPLKIVEFGLQFLPETNDDRIEKFRTAVNKGTSGSIIDIKGGDDSTRVEVSLE